MENIGRPCTPSIFGKLIAALLVALIPYVHIGVIHKLIWVPNKPPVNRTHCRCDCFDTVFKGSYERLGKTSYKHVYFNATFEMLIVWVMTLCVIIVSYESFKHIHDLYRQNLIRWKMLFLFILDIYPNYYSFWVYVNYINDGFYHQFFHQLFFTLSELYSTWNVFRLCSTHSESDSWRLLAIIAISLIHILLGGVDQFFTQLILWHDNTFQRFRNLGFILPDVLHVLLAVQVLAEKRRTSWKDAFTKTEWKYGSILVFGGFLIGKFIFH